MVLKPRPTLDLKGKSTSRIGYKKKNCTKPSNHYKNLLLNHISNT